MQVVTGIKPADKTLIALSSVAKTFVGQLVETGERGGRGAGGGGGG